MGNGRSTEPRGDGTGPTSIHGPGDSPCRERESSGECRWRPFSTADSTYVSTNYDSKEIATGFERTDLECPRASKWVEDLNLSSFGGEKLS